MMEQEREIFKSKDQFAALWNEVKEAAENGIPIDQIEKELWSGLMNLGRIMLEETIDRQGNGRPRSYH